MKDKGNVAVAVLGSIVALLLLVGVVVVGYQLNWWLRGQEVNRSAKINNESYNRQTGLVTSILDDIKQVDGPNVPTAQRKAVIAEICNNAEQLTAEFRYQLSYTTQSFLLKECV